MALSSVFNRSVRQCTRLICTSPISKVQKNEPNKALTAEFNSIDDFTTQLIQSKVNKWTAQNPIQPAAKKVFIGQSACENELEDIASLNKEELNQLFQNTADSFDNEKLLRLMKQCIKLKRCPSLHHIFYTLSVSSKIGDKSTIEDIRQLCEYICPEVLRTNANFQHYVAEAVWIKGNINESLRIFRNIYSNTTHLRRNIREMLKFLILNTVSRRSEVALVSIIKFSEDLKNEYADFFPLTYVWQTCFLSEWFSDQCIAFDLLTKHDGLCGAVTSRIPYVVAVSLKNHNTELVHRLFEVLLHFDMKSQYEGVLLALLDYQIRQGNTQRCLEIVQWSLQNDVQLPPVYHKNFVSLLLGSGPDFYLKSTKNMPKIETHFKF
nr:uncharacterized protein LOC111502376 [Leptinotarsa decemlineata]